MRKSFQSRLKRSLSKYQSRLLSPGRYANVPLVSVAPLATPSSRQLPAASVMILPAMGSKRPRPLNLLNQLFAYPHETFLPGFSNDPNQTPIFRHRESHRGSRSEAWLCRGANPHHRERNPPMTRRFHPFVTLLEVRTSLSQLIPAPAPSPVMDYGMSHSTPIIFAPVDTTPAKAPGSLLT